MRFDPTCLSTTVSPYAAQFYDGAADYGSATTLTIASVADFNVNATLAAGASITGTVTAPGAVNAANICVEAVDALNGYVVRLATTDPAGGYDLTNLPAATYKVAFDPGCENTTKSDFALGWYSGNASFSTATTLPLAAGQVVSTSTTPLRFPARRCPFLRPRCHQG